MINEDSARPDPTDKPYVLAPVLIFLGVLAIAVGGILYMRSTQTTMEDEAGDAAVALANIDRARQGLPLLEPDDRSANRAVLAAAFGGGAVLLVIGVLVWSAEARHRETLAAIQKAQTGASGE